MGLKGYRLWVMAQLDSNVQSPTAKMPMRTNSSSIAVISPPRFAGDRKPTSTVALTHSRGVSDWAHVRPELDLWVALTPGGCQIGHMCDQNSTYGSHSLPGDVRLGTWLYILAIHTGCHTG
jgi:hypothetical protein